MKNVLMTKMPYTHSWQFTQFLYTMQSTPTLKAAPHTVYAKLILCLCVCVFTHSIKVLCDFLAGFLFLANSHFQDQVSPVYFS